VRVGGATGQLRGATILTDRREVRYLLECALLGLVADTSAHIRPISGNRVPPPPLITALCS
jgi:hypothetical protein